jgi:hypothetical protein
MRVRHLPTARTLHSPPAMRARQLAPLSLLTIAACITHLPPRTTAHQRITWQPTFAAAARVAVADGKPMLAVLAAGERDGLC